MIANEREYRITCEQIDRLRKASRAFNISEVAKRVGSQTLAQAELEAITSEIEELSAQIEEYEALKSRPAKM